MNAEVLIIICGFGSSLIGAFWGSTLGIDEKRDNGDLGGLLLNLILILFLSLLISLICIGMLP